MSYSYDTERPYVFTEEGQVQLLAVLRCARVCLELAGAVRCDKLLEAASCPNNWKPLALVDRLVELKMLREVDQGFKPHGQDRLFVAGSVPL